MSQFGWRQPRALVRAVSCGALLWTAAAVAQGPQAGAPAPEPPPSAAAPSGEAAPAESVPPPPSVAAPSVEPPPSAAAASSEPEPPPSASVVAASAADADTRALGAVVVTAARYRVEDAQEVPIPITTVSGEQLRAIGGVRSLNQLQGQLPSLNIQGYSGRNQTITIRGLGTNAGSTNDGLEQGVGLYVDGVYRPRTGSVITDLVDVESVQLLRGPQGTLFGKNTVAGAIDIQTLQPSFQRYVRAEIGYGNHDYLRGYFSVNQPLTDTLALKVSYLRTSRGGLIYNTTYDEPWDDLNNDAARVDLLWKPDDHFKTRFIADYSMQRCNCGFQVVAQALPTRLADGRSARGFYERARDVGYQPPPIDPFARRTDINSSQADRMPSMGLQNRADYRFDSDLALTSITAYRRWQWLPHYDGDQFGANIQKLGVVETHQQQFSQELRLTSPGDQLFDYTAGLYYFWQEMDDDQHATYASQASGWLVSPTTNPAVLDGLDAYAHVIPATHSVAAYGQGTLNLGRRFHATAGLRFTFEHKTGKYDAYPRGDAAPLESLPEDQRDAAAMSRASIATTGKYSKSLDVHNLSWLGTVAYDLTDAIHAFGTYARGYKSPGINLVAQSVGVDVFVQPETVDDFELGLKASFLNGRLQINPSAFYIFDKNYQANFINTSGSRAVGYITNVGTLVSRGLELDVQLLPLQGLRGSFAFTYNDARYSDYKNAPAQYLTSYESVLDLSGRRASGVSRFAAGALLEYSVPVAHAKSSPIELYFGGNWSFRSDFYAAVNLDPFSRVPRYHLVGLNAGLRNASGRWDVSFWIRNLLDTDTYNTRTVYATNGIVLAALGEPRLFGATLRGEL